MTFLIIVHVLICVFLVCVILLQPGKSDGGGIGFGSSSQSVFGSRGAGNFLTKTTSACAIIFLVTSFFLTRSRIKEFSGSVIKAEPKKPAPTAPATPADPGKAATEKLQDAVKGAGQPSKTEPSKAIPPAGNSKAPAPSKAAPSGGTSKAGEPTK